MKFKYRRYLLYYLALPFVAAFSALPMRAGVRIGGAMGALAFRLLPKYRELAIENLTAAFGEEKTGRQIEAIARKVFENLGKNVAEGINSPKLSPVTIDRLVTMVNKERLEKAFGAGKGVLILTGHFGNWELLAQTLRIKGYPGVAIGKRIYFDKFDKLLNRYRLSQDVRIIYRDESPKKVLRVLKENRIVGILADQDVDSVRGVFVDFFGRPAYTPIAPVQLARASGAKLVPTFLIRRHDDRHDLILEEPLELSESQDKEADMLKDTQRWTAIFESYIRRYPEQWVWMHRRWKTQPAGSVRKG